MPTFDSELRLKIARVGFAGIAFITGLPGIGCNPPITDNIPTAKVGTPLPKPAERKIIPDLGLTIDESGFWRTVVQGARWGVLPNTAYKDKLGCPSWSPGICVGAYSTNFKVGINGPMADFMFRQTRVFNPIKPIKMIFVEDWLKADDGTYLTGGINKSDTVIDIAVSLKAVAWNVFKIMENEGTLVAPNADEHFEGTMSILASRTAVHELAHAGAQVEKLGLRSDGIEVEAVHPQIYAFDERYDALVRQAAARGLPEGGLIFGVQPLESVNRLSYMNRIAREAQNIGLNYPMKPN